MTAIPPALFSRLTLAKDLASASIALLDPSRHAADQLQGVVLLDLSVDVALRTAVGELGRKPAGDKFHQLLSAVPELGPAVDGLGILHKTRNLAQHGGVAPVPSTVFQLRDHGLVGLRALFPLVGSNFDQLSSVPQLATDHFKPALEQALTRVDSAPNDAAALAARVFLRLHGWASHLAGDALVPEEMWVFSNGRWEDLRITSACADKREQFIGATLDVAGGQLLGIGLASLLRFRNLAWGHTAVLNDSGWTFTHDEKADAVPPDDARWMIELIARTALRLEHEWEDYRLVRQEPPDLRGAPLAERTEGAASRDAAGRKSPGSREPA